MAWPDGSDKGCIQQDGVTDSDRGIFAKLLSAAAALAAGYNAARAWQIAQDEWDLAKRYWRIAQSWMDYYRDHFAPVEDQEVKEALALTDPLPEYEVARGRARTVAWLQFRGALRKTTRCTSRYCTGLRQDMLADLMTAQANAVALADGLGYRNERAYIEARSDVRFKQQLETAKRGRNMVADNVSLGKATAGIYGDLWDQAWTGLEGAGAYLGYFNNRNATHYPTTFTASEEQSVQNTNVQTQPRRIAPESER